MKVLLVAIQDLLSWGKDCLRHCGALSVGQKWDYKWFWNSNFIFHPKFEDSQLLPRHLLTARTLCVSQYSATQPPSPWVPSSLLECTKTRLSTLPSLRADGCAPWPSRHGLLRSHRWTLAWRHGGREVTERAKKLQRLHLFHLNISPLPFLCPRQWPPHFVEVLVSVVAEVRWARVSSMFQVPLTKAIFLLLFLPFLKCRHFLFPVPFIVGLKSPQL